ncbi:helix-turn-helix transcriptional regulator [Hydrogenophaga bisanensis]|uniref:Helix-turn-helix transcriptional regulator n=1 Tax=Hydrogenophaga bisanensis TaxID=439611 RepID=A0ABW2R3V6_9BURK
MLNSSPLKILRLKQLIALTGLCRSSIYNRLNPRSASYDHTFPQPFNLSACPGKRGAVGFLESEVQAWIEARVQTSRGRAQSTQTSAVATARTDCASAERKWEVRRV